MNCEEFLRQFRDALDGKVSENVIQDNVKYYRSYINSQTAGGKSEADVLRMLGDPRLLAKTIEESSKFASEKESQNEYTNNFYGKSSSNYANYSSTGSMNHEYTDTADEKRGRIPGWLIACIVLLVFFFVLLFAFRVFIWIAPYIIVVMLVGFVIRSVQNWWRRR